MAKVNYQFQKAERERAKLAKKEAKRREADRDQDTKVTPPATDVAPEPAPTES